MDNNHLITSSGPMKLRILFSYTLLNILCLPLMVWAQTEVRTWDDLNALRTNLAGTYILMNNLDENSAGYSNYASGDGWLPVGTAEAPFTGTLDGQGYVIENLRSSRGVGNVGMFGVTSGATVKNLTITQAEITAAASSSGVLIGNATDTRIEKVHVSGSFDQVDDTGATSFGGIVGRMVGGIITESSSGVTITTVGRFVGGLIGTATSGVTIETSFNTGNINSQFRWIGGLVGQFGGSSIIRDSYSTGNITGTTQVGGLVGFHWRASEIYNSYTTGTVTGDEEVGALSGFIDPPQGEAIAVIERSYFNSETSGVSVGASNNPDYNGNGKSSSELRTESTFTDWDFTTVWTFVPEVNDGFPVLQHQTATSVDGLDAIPVQVQLSQNFPNPFNPTTTIRFELPASQHVQLAVYSVAGQLIGTLVNEIRPAGVHEVRFDAGQLSSGVYIYQLRAGETSVTRRMTLIK